MAQQRMDAGRRGRDVSRPDVVRQARTAGSRRGFYLALLAVGVLGAALIAWATSGSSASSVVTVDPKAAVGLKAEGYVLGSASAPVEIVEFADFECPGCAQFAVVTEPDIRERLVKTGQARYRLFDFPINDSHRNSPAASLAAACANDQGKFWEMHDRIFAGQQEWMTGATDDPKAVFARYAQAIGLNTATWERCFDARTHVGRSAAHLQEAMSRGVQSTPTFLIGGRKVEGGQATYDQIKALVDSARLAAGAPPAGAAGTPAAPAP